MSLEKKLEQVLDSAEMAYSEAYSARESLPDYNANESARTTMSQAESYLDDAIGDLQDIIKKLTDLWTVSEDARQFGGDTGTDADFPHFTESLATFAQSLIEN